MEKIRTQFLVLLILVMALFGAVIVVDSLVSDQINHLYNLETRITNVLLQWTRLVGQSSGLLANGDPVESVCQTWKRDFDAYLAKWQGQLSDLETLASDDPQLMDQVSWVRSTLGMGMGEMAYLEENLDKLLALLRSESPEIMQRISMARLGDTFSESAEISPGVRSNLFRIRDSAHFFDQMLGSMGSSQERFELQTTQRIQELKARFDNTRLIFLAGGVIVLIIFLTIILRMNGQLLDLVRQRTADLVKAMADLESTQAILVETKRQAAMSTLIVGISHEINTPLGVLTTAITRLQESHQDLAERSASQTLTRPQFTSSLELQTNLLELSEKSASRIRELIRHFRSLSAYDEGLIYSRIMLDVRLQPWMEMLAKDVAQRGHVMEWSCEAGLEIVSSEQALIQVFRQLLDNSLDFAFPADRLGTISISIRREDNQIRIEYVDDGVGIAAELSDRIFEPFFTTGRGTKHVGLGLNVVHNLIVQFLGGSIVLEQRSVGTGFIMRLPLTFQRNPATVGPSGGSV